MRSYEAARSLFSFLGFCAWTVVVIGVLVALVGAGSVSRYAGGGIGLLAMGPGIGIGIAGLILVAFVQMGRATVDTAEYTQQMLKIARDQLEVSKQALKPRGQTTKSFATAAKESRPQKAKGFSNTGSKVSLKTQPSLKRPKVSQIMPEVLKDGQITEYLGHQIKRIADEYMVGGRSLYTLNLAQHHIEKNFRYLVYNDAEIQVVRGKYCTDEKAFETIEEIKEYVDTLPKPNSKPLPAAWEP